jgi:beta-lactamase regulating signal transducer with metallopeptidase domain
MSAWEWAETETFDAALSASLFFSVIVLAMLACRQPARRILIARVALLASLAIIPLSRVESLPRVDLLRLLLTSDLVPHTLFVSVSPDASPPRPLIPPTPSRTLQRTLPDSHVHSNVTTWGWVVHAVVLLVWAGMAAGFAWLLLGLAGVRWLIRHSRPPSTEARSLHQELVGLGSPVGRRSVLRVSTRVRRPVVVGLLRPTILIPESLDLPSAEPGALRLSLLHELAHVERYDYGFSAVANLAQTVWFFLPHTWWLRSRLMIDQEFLADQSAAIRYGSVSNYASSLLVLAARPWSKETTLPVDALPSAPPRNKNHVPSALFQRMLMLLHCPFPIETRTPRLWSWSWNLAVVGAAVLAACLVVRWPDVVNVDPRSKTHPAPNACRFHVEYFVAEPLPGPPNGRSVAYVIPLTLPPLFDLDVEVRSFPNDLDQIRIAGYPLRHGLPHQSGHLAINPMGSIDGAAWRHVHVHRDHQNVTVEVDGQTISEGPLPEATTEYLTIEPGPQGAAEFRDLTVTW